MVVDNSFSLTVSKSHSLSPHIASVCREAKKTTFAPEQLLKEYLHSDDLDGLKKDISGYFSFNEQYSGKINLVKGILDSSCVFFTRTEKMFPVKL